MEVKGFKNSKRIRVSFTQLGPERDAATYIPTSAMAEMIITGKIGIKGVVCPEALGLDPKPIMEEVKKVGAVFTEEVDEW